ncbi:putative nucleic acid-binding protein [Medicago truncatula]|uniref:Putative nucleic acid-binding protein n=1 Tax=Medicago truncatula TaxID=3880 RepID=A0A396JXX8_MEDTR|nr:putative nucleic acid-binding protein [Medicago truncatula]
MAPLITPVAAIVAGKINIKLRVRVVHVWTVSEFNNPNEDNSIHMLLLDDKLGKIQASAKKHLVPRIRSNVEEGSTYDIENVLVTKNDPKYQVTQHRFKLNLIDNTKFFKIDAATIPLNHFDFMPFNEILEAEREEKVVDVIGQVVERDELKERDVNGRRSKIMDLTLQDSESRRVHCTLWANYAERMNSFLAAHDPSSPVIVLIQQCKLKKYQGIMGVSNAFFGTKLLLEGDLPEAIEFKSKIDGGDVQVSQSISQNTTSTVVSLVDDMLQTKRMTIEDLIEATEVYYVTLYELK